MTGTATAEPIRIIGVGRTFGGAAGTVALEQVDLVVQEREFVCLLGASGCGKSTLLSLIADLDAPTTGTIDLGGRRTAVMFQDANLFPWLTVAGNIELALRFSGVPKADWSRRVTELLDVVRLPGAEKRRPHELSGGMRQRVTIALATVCRPDFIIADEPTTALDVVVQKGVLGMIRRLQKEMGSSVLFVTHDMAVHANLTDRLGIMYAGRLVEEAPTRALFRRPLHPYTAHLIRSLPRIGDDAPRHGLEGKPPSLAAPPPGCRFHPRCPLAMDICRREVPAMLELAPGHRVACHAAAQGILP